MGLLKLNSTGEKARPSMHVQKPCACVHPPRHASQQPPLNNEFFSHILSPIAFRLEFSYIAALDLNRFDYILNFY